MARPNSPTVSRKELANSLRSMRIRARKTLEEAAAALEVSAATVSRIENGIRVPRARDVKDLCAFYGITEAHRVNEMAALVADARESGWWEAYTEVDEAYSTFIGLEAAATVVDQFERAVVPTFLQTAAYAAAWQKFGVSPSRTTPLTEHDIAKRVEVLARRQQLLENTGLKYTIILDEVALLRPVGGLDVMQEQLEHLVRASDRPNTEILVLPLAHGAHPGQSGSFAILTLPQNQVSDVVYLDSPGGQLFLESAEELQRYRKLFEILRNMSLNSEASVEVFKNRLRN